MMDQNGQKRIAVGATAASPAAYIPNNHAQPDKKQPFQRQGTHQPTNHKNGPGILTSGPGGAAAIMKHTAMRPAEINTSKAPQYNNQMKLVRMMTVNNSPDKRNMNSNITAANPSLKKAMAAAGGSPSITAADGGYSPGAQKTNNLNGTNLTGEGNNNNIAATNPPGAAGQLRTQENSLTPDDTNTPLTAIQQKMDETMQGIQEEIPKNEVVISMALKSKQIARDLRKLQESKSYSDHYEFQSVLGEGAFCTVYRAVDKETNEQIAVKVIKRKTLQKEGVQLLKQEAELLQSMDHQNIVKFKHFKEIKGKIFLGMELMRGGQLSQLIMLKKRQGIDFSDEEASQIIKAIFEAVNYLHTNEIVHRDLKPDNILIADPDDLSTIKVADFGLSAKYEQNNETDQVGTLIFMSPELIKKRQYTAGVDVFAVGVVMYMLLTGGKHPLYQSDEFLTEKYKTQLLALSQFQFPEHLSPLAANLFHRLTKFNLKMRYTAHEALKHPWITRLNKTLIPMTLQDKIENMRTEQDFRTKIGMMLFLSNVSHSENYFENSSFLDYKKHLQKVCNKIDKWYDKRQCDSDLNQRFSKDEDYVEIDESPDKFESTDEEEEEIKSIEDATNRQSHEDLVKSEKQKIRRSTQRPKEKSFESQGENRMRLLQTQKQMSEGINQYSNAKNHGMSINTGGKRASGKANRDDDRFEAIQDEDTSPSPSNKRNGGVTNFQSYAQPQNSVLFREKSPGLKKSVGLAGQQLLTGQNAANSPRKRKSKKKEAQQVAISQADHTKGQYEAHSADQLASGAPYNNAGPRNNQTGASYNLNSVIPEKSYIQKPSKSATKKHVSVIKREDIILSSNKKPFNSPKHASEAANQSSNVYSVVNQSSSQKQIGDYSNYHQSPFGKYTANKDHHYQNHHPVPKEYSQVDKYPTDGTNNFPGSYSGNQGTQNADGRNESFERLYSSFEQNRGIKGAETPEKYRAKKMANNATSLRSQEFVDDRNVTDSNEYHSIIEAKKQFGESHGGRSTGKGKPLSINLKAMRRTSQASALKSNQMQFISSDRRQDQDQEAATSVNTTQKANMNAAFNDSAQFCGEDLSPGFRREDYILGGQSVIPQPMCESQLQSDITQTDDLRTDKFITLASKSAAMGYEFSQNEEMCASNNSSPSSENRIDYQHQGDAIIDPELRLPPKQRKGSKNRKKKAGNKERVKEKKPQYFQGHATQQMIANTPNGMSNYQYLLSEEAQKQQQIANDLASLDKQKGFQRGLGASAAASMKDHAGNIRVCGNGSTNTSISHQHAANRLELERKRNTSYDQKFLFKKNFISKYQPNSGIPMGGQIGGNFQHNNHHQNAGKHFGQSKGGKHHNQFGVDGKRHHDANFKLKPHQGKKGAHLIDNSAENTPIKMKSMPPSFRPVVIQGINALNGANKPLNNDLPQIVEQNRMSNPHSHMHQQQQMSYGHAQNIKQMKSGSAQGDRSTTNEFAKHRKQSKKKSKQEEQELTAVRHRIGNILSSNNVLDENTGKELFKKDLSSQNANPQNNPFMLAADSGLAPPPSNYVRSRPSDDHMTGRADQSSETTVRSRNKIEGIQKSELKSATQKITKKKADEAIGGVILESGKAGSGGGANSFNAANMSSSHSRKKSQTKLYAGKLTDSTGMPSTLNNEFMPQTLEHRQSQQLSQHQMALAFGQPQHQSHQQRTQSNPNNRVTAFIKIQHMPAEILLKEQQKHAPQNNMNQSNGSTAMRGHHFNAMMAQQRSTHSEGHPQNAHHHLNQFTNAGPNSKMSPYSNNQIKSWGRPVKSQYQQHPPAEQLLNAEKSLIVTDSTKQKKEQQLRQLSIARNVQQMGNTTATIPFTRKSTNTQKNQSAEPHSPKVAATGSCFTLGQTNPTLNIGHSKTPFAQYDPVMSAGVLEPGVGITGISVNEKSNYQSYFNQITGTQRGAAVQPQAVIQYTGSHYPIAPNHQNPNLEQTSYMLNAGSALDMEILANQSEKSRIYGQQSAHQMNEKSQKLGAPNPYRVAQAQGPQGTANSNNNGDVYQNQQAKGEFSYGRQNSDQTAYMRNMRSVLHHNGLQQKNNFINMGAQQLSQKIVQSSQTTANSGQPQQQQQQQYPPQSGFNNSQMPMHGGTSNPPDFTE